MQGLPQRMFLLAVLSPSLEKALGPRPPSWALPALLIGGVHVLEVSG